MSKHWECMLACGCKTLLIASDDAPDPATLGLEYRCTRHGPRPVVGAAPLPPETAEREDHLASFIEQERRRTEPVDTKGRT